jgi:hypothetical protein
MEAFAPGYAATRKAAAGELKDLPSMERARRVLEMIPQRAAEQASDMFDEIDFEVDVDPKEAARNLFQGLSAWVRSVGQQIRVVSKEQMKERFGAPATGAYAPAGKRGAEGQVYVQLEDRWKRFGQALLMLKRISEGTVDPLELGAQGLQEMKKSLLDFVGTIGHENVHKYAKDWQKSLTLITQSLRSKGPMGVFGPQREAMGRFIQKVPNVRAKYERAMQARGALAAGVGEIEVSGRGGEKRVVQVTQETVQRLMNSFYRAMAEELLAYQFNPRVFAEKMGEIPEQIQEFLTKRFKEWMG